MKSEDDDDDNMSGDHDGQRMVVMEYQTETVLLETCINQIIDMLFAQA